MKALRARTKARALRIGFGGNALRGAKVIHEFPNSKTHTRGPVAHVMVHVSSAEADAFSSAVRARLLHLKCGPVVWPCDWVFWRPKLGRRLGGCA